MKTTESDSLHDNLEQMSTRELLTAINSEDKKVPDALEKVISGITSLVDEIAEKMKNGGRLFYIGAGTSGRLGIVDASECPPTFGIEPGRVIGIIAGGDAAIRNAVEFAEDDIQQGWNDLRAFGVSSADVVVGIAASGSTPYVVAAVKKCNEENIATACITCNIRSELGAVAKYPVEIAVGPEFVTGSTRLKSGTAQKLALNMISTAVMIRLGRVKGNKMVDMQLSNNKLVDRGTRMLMKNTGMDDYEKAKRLLLEHGSVRKATDSILRG